MEAMPATHERMTAEEHLSQPEPPNGRRSELNDGEVVVNKPTWLHSTVKLGL